MLISDLQMLVLDYTLLEFSQEPGYISLTDSSRSKLNISVMKIYVGKKLLQLYIT